MLSFHATKLFHTAEGGALVVRDQLLHERIELMKNFGIKNESEVAMPGINGKMNELQAALGPVDTAPGRSGAPRQGCHRLRLSRASIRHRGTDVI